MARSTASGAPQANAAGANTTAHTAAHTTANATANTTAERQRAIQRRQDERDRQAEGGKGGGKSGGKGGKGNGKDAGAVQAGARPQPVELPAQHIDKPGSEAELALAPRFLAPDYLGSGKLADRVALITGGDSGIGRSVAVLFAREGADVAITYLGSDEEDDARETERHVHAEGRRCLLLPGDVRDSGFCNRAVERVIEVLGRLDVLVNNAAFQEHAGRIEDITDDRLQETLDTNIGGYFHMTRAAVPHLGNGSAIINTGSVVGLRGSARLLDYAATKGAIHTFTKSLASQLIDKGIRVNAVAPGPVWTPLNPADSQAEQVSRFGSDTDMKRVAQPEELSPAYVFLASPVTAGYITGIVLPVTGSVDAI